MLKLERFIKEYANYKIREVNNLYNIPMLAKNSIVDQIGRICKYRTFGMITADEAIKSLSEIKMGL